MERPLHNSGKPIHCPWMMGILIRGASGIAMSYSLDTRPNTCSPFGLYAVNLTRFDLTKDSKTLSQVFTVSPTKEDFLKAYNKMKANNKGVPPKCEEFLDESGYTLKQLKKVFSNRKPYTKLQILAGDEPNAWRDKTPISVLMERYGDLAARTLKEAEELPILDDWDDAGLKPTHEGLKKVHGFKWGQFQDRFKQFCDDNPEFASQYPEVLNAISKNPVRNRTNKQFDDVHSFVQEWVPPIRMHGEREYQADLAAELKHSPIFNNVKIRQEKGESRTDIGVGSEVCIEMKKSPTQTEYDRCFGQIARHLENYDYVVALILDVKTLELFDDFNELVDKYFKECVRVVKKRG